MESKLDLRVALKIGAGHMEQRMRQDLAAMAQAHQLRLDIDQLWHMNVVDFDARIVSGIEASAEQRGIPHRRIITGAGHDALSMSEVCPTAMIFVPCKDGISHNEAESAEPDDLEAGANVLLDVTLKLAEIAQ